MTHFVISLLSGITVVTEMLRIALLTVCYYRIFIPVKAEWF